jgi:hypothetical protein
MANENHVKAFMGIVMVMAAAIVGRVMICTPLVVAAVKASDVLFFRCTMLAVCLVV